MKRNVLDKAGFRSLAAGEELAVETFYRELYSRFRHMISRYLHDDHARQEAFNDAFLKLLNHVATGRLSWQGVGPFLDYFKKTLQTTCLDHLRCTQKDRQWAADHLLPSMVESPDGVCEERVELLGEPCQVEQEIIAEQWARLVSEVFSGFLKRLTSQECLLLEAYRHLIAIPGGNQWPHHKKTAFLQEKTGLQGNVFYVAHARFKKKSEPTVRRLGMLC